MTPQIEIPQGLEEQAKVQAQRILLDLGVTKEEHEAEILKAWLGSVHAHIAVGMRSHA